MGAPPTPSGGADGAVAARRPFYVFGHNPNKINDVERRLREGANAIEPDINVFADRPNVLCVSHGRGSATTPALDQYLRELRDRLAHSQQLALVVFDCKREAATAPLGRALLDSIREHLTHGTDLSVIISIAKRDRDAGSIFDRIHGDLGPREGLMIDDEGDPRAVADFFSELGVANQCYGNGTAFLNTVFGPGVRHCYEQACELQAGEGRPRFIYAYSVNDAAHLRECIRIGVNGIITDHVPRVTGILGESEFSAGIRLATRGDDPFSPANLAYGLAIHTGNAWRAGTDARVTFTVTGDRASASKTVDTNLIKRMERNDWNYVTLPSRDLGTLRSITVQRDDAGRGPDWFLDRITVRSVRFSEPTLAIFNRWIDTTSPFVQALVSVPSPS